MLQKIWVVIYLTCVALAIHKDYNTHFKTQETVQVTSRLCGKNEYRRIFKTTKWNQTLYMLPGITVKPFRPTKPEEAFFQKANVFEFADRIRVPYSEEAYKMDLVSEWNNKTDYVCLYVNRYPSICNLFRGCVLWPLSVPFKGVFYILNINIHTH